MEFNIEALQKLSIEQKSMIMQVWEREMIQKMAVDVNEIKDKLDKQNEEISAMQNTINETKELARTSMVLKSHQYGFVNQKDIGFAINPSVGSKTAGILLKIIGLAQTHTSLTTPYRDSIASGYATSEPSPGGYTCYYWNLEKVMTKLDKWLNQNNEYNNFYSHKTEEERKEWIYSKARDLKV